MQTIIQREDLVVVNLQTTLHTLEKAHSRAENIFAKKPICTMSCTMYLYGCQRLWELSKHNTWKQRERGKHQPTKEDTSHTTKRERKARNAFRTRNYRQTDRNKSCYNQQCASVWMEIIIYLGTRLHVLNHIFYTISMCTADIQRVPLLNK